MKVYELVAAAVLRSGLAGYKLSWAQLGEAFNITKDSARHQLNRFKDKYNVVDADVVGGFGGWNRDFLRDNTPDSEKLELDSSANVPGDVITANGKEAVIVDGSDNYVYLEEDVVIKGTEVAIDDQDDEDESSFVDDAYVEETEPVAPAPKMEPLQFLITPAVLVVVRDGQALTIDKSHKNFDKIETSLKAGEWQAVLDYIDLKNTLTKFSNGRVVVENGKVTLDGDIVSGKLVPRLVNLLLEENSESLESLTAFLANCDENPDFRVVSRIYDFMAHNDLRTDKEGYILAYKVVKNNYLDKYTGKMDNSPGKLVAMKRNKVNPKDEETCSFGLHVAARAYIPSYGRPSLSSGGDRVVLVRVHPKDFVSIPTDYNSMKARVCEYTVLKDVTELFCANQLETEGVKV